MMSGICSAHKEFVAGCPQCEAIGVEKPAMECHKCAATNCVEGCVNWQVYASYLESRLKEAEEACGDAVVFIKAHPICVDLMPFTAAHIAKKLEKALKDLGKDKP